MLAGCPAPPVPDPVGPFCGGFAGFGCPGAGECVDDPRDDCDPSRGGADCGGVCECNTFGLCTPGLEWDASPEVCGCAPRECDRDYDPCIAATCAVGNECVAVGCDAHCVPAEETPCGDATCAAGMVCCNASCGICTEPGGVCIQIACVDE
jgi:hypothetical protein